MKTTEQIKIDISCPKCNVKNKVSLSQINNKAVLICRGCGRKIQLMSEGDDISQIGKSIEKLEKTIEGINKNFNI